MAFNHRGISSGDRELFAFSIAPHFYETRTFIGVGAASILLFAFGLRQLRLQRQRTLQRLEQEAALGRERIRIA